MQEGQAAHTQWQEDRSQHSSDFQKEVVISYTFMISGWEVTISGRMDGLSFLDGTWIVEELKSSTSLSTQLATLQIDDLPSWRRQVELYVFFLEAQGKIAKGRLIVISIADGSLCRFNVPQNPDIEAYVHSQIDYIISQHEERQNWLEKRFQAALTGLPFPHPTYRQGQKQLVQEIENALSEERQILLHAPTGYGKTAAALHAAIQVAYRAGVSVFVATARTTQQHMVEDTITRLSELGVPIRGLSIRAKEKICLNEVVSCRPENCRYSEDYFDKVRNGKLHDLGWRLAEKQGGAWPDILVDIGESAQACPYALGMELAEMADVVVGDYNYLFSPTTRLKWIDANPKKWILIVDEVHNLPERAMGYGSPKVSLLQAWRAWQACESSMLFRPFSEPMREISWWLHDRLERQIEGEESQPVENNIDRSWLSRIAGDIEAMALEFAVQQFKYPLFSEEEGDPWTETAFAFLRLNQALDKSGEETVIIWRKGPLDRLTRSRAAKKARKLWGDKAWSIDATTGIQLLCRDPVHLLEPHFRNAFATLAMSATAQPFEFYHDLLGLSDKRARRLHYPSPFPPANSFQAVIADVSTAYRDRERDRLKTAEQICHSVLATPGNVAVYFPSFKMMNDLRPHLDFEERPVLVQESRMSDDERQVLLSEMRRGQGHVLLAVLGGIFSEGVDLPADALKCAVVVGPSLPKATLGRRLLQEWYQQKYNKGFQYAWLVPGLARVGQAAGRVIRSPTDVGTVVLIGKRFLQKGYQSCLPAEWSLMRSRDIYSDLTNFWDIVVNGQTSKDS